MFAYQVASSNNIGVVFHACFAIGMAISDSIPMENVYYVITSPCPLLFAEFVSDSCDSEVLVWVFVRPANVHYVYNSHTCWTFVWFIFWLMLNPYTDNMFLFPCLFRLRDWNPWLPWVNKSRRSGGSSSWNRLGTAAISHRSFNWTAVDFRLSRGIFSFTCLATNNASAAPGNNWEMFIPTAHPTRWRWSPPVGYKDAAAFVDMENHSGKLIFSFTSNRTAAGVLSLYRFSFRPTISFHFSSSTSDKFLHPHTFYYWFPPPLCQLRDYFVEQGEV